MNRTRLAIGALVALGTTSFGVATLTGCSGTQTASTTVEWKYPVRIDIRIGEGQVIHRNDKIGTDGDNQLRYTYDGSLLEVRYGILKCLAPSLYPDVYTWFECIEEYGNCTFRAIFPDREV